MPCKFSIKRTWRGAQGMKEVRCVDPNGGSKKTTYTADHTNLSNDRFAATQQWHLIRSSINGQKTSTWTHRQLSNYFCNQSKFSFGSLLNARLEWIKITHNILKLSIKWLQLDVPQHTFSAPRSLSHMGALQESSGEYLCKMNNLLQTNYTSLWDFFCPPLTWPLFGMQRNQPR